MLLPPWNIREKSLFGKTSAEMFHLDLGINKIYSPKTLPPKLSLFNPSSLNFSLFNPYPINPSLFYPYSINPSLFNPYPFNRSLFNSSPSNPSLSSSWSV
jgi:hypothetical protein